MNSLISQQQANSTKKINSTLPTECYNTKTMVYYNNVSKTLLQNKTATL